MGILKMPYTVTRELVINSPRSRVAILSLSILSAACPILMFPWHGKATSTSVVRPRDLTQPADYVRGVLMTIDYRVYRSHLPSQQLFLFSTKLLHLHAELVRGYLSRAPIRRLSKGSHISSSSTVKRGLLYDRINSTNRTQWYVEEALRNTLQIKF